jgi:hypothetical protein
MSHELQMEVCNIRGIIGVCFYRCIHKGICSLYLGKLITHLVIYVYLPIDFNEGYLLMNYYFRYIELFNQLFITI